MFYADMKSQNLKVKIQKSFRWIFKFLLLISDFSFPPIYILCLSKLAKSS